jgi:hypothetical protein
MVEGELPPSVGMLPHNKPPRYQMNQSTIIMVSNAHCHPVSTKVLNPFSQPCNNSGYMDPKRTVG